MSRTVRTANVNGGFSGRWLYMPECASLSILPNPDLPLWDFEVRLDTCRTPMQLGEWVAHLAGKSWCSDADIGEFVRAVRQVWRAGK